jgi:histidine ammonia-lyase
MAQNERTGTTRSLPRPVPIGARVLNIEDVVAVARDGAKVHVVPEAHARLERSRRTVERLALSDEPIYGLTTGLGAAVDTRLEANDATAFQRRAIMARAVGVGDYLGIEEVRATLFVRLAGISQGASGLSPAFAHTIEAMLNHRVHPRVRRIGTLGESDLSALAGLFLPFAGEGEVEWEGKVLPGGTAFERAAITIPPFGPKDGIALVNANAFGVALGALAVHEAELSAEALIAAGALSLEAFRANLSPLDERVVRLRAAPGQNEATRRLHRLLAGSDLYEPGNARRVQDPLSFRCLAPVHGAMLECLKRARAAIEADLNGAGDSPAVLIEDEEIVSSVNFDTTAIAIAFESLGLAAAHGSAISVFRTIKLMSPAFSGLPRFLTRHGGSRSGFSTVQKTAAALDAEIRHLAQPIGGMTAPVADGVEDYAPMTPRIVEKTRKIIQRLARLAALELIVAAQGLDLRDAVQNGRGTAAARRFVRSRIPFLDDDRPMGSELEMLARAIEAGELRAVIGEAASE